MLVDGGRYYAAATNEDGNNLPTMSSEDLRTRIRQLIGKATKFAKGSKAHQLRRTSQAWEGSVT